MAQPTKTEYSPLQLFGMLVGGGAVTTIGSAILIQYIPIRLFVIGLILGPLFVVGGLLVPFIWLLAPKEPRPILYGEPAQEMIAFHCRHCQQRYVSARRLRGVEFTCRKCQTRDEISIDEAVSSEEWLSPAANKS